MRELIAENLMVMLRDLESCAGNDALMSESDMRRTAHTLPLLLAGADFMFSGFGSIPALRQHVRAVATSTPRTSTTTSSVQRDWGVDGGLRARDDAELLPLRRRAAEACRAVYAELGLADFTDDTSTPCVQAHGSLDVPAPDPQLVPERGATRSGARARRSSTSCAALARRGYDDEAERVLEHAARAAATATTCRRPRSSTSEMRVLSALTDPNDYAGPGTGYRMPTPSAGPRSAHVRQARTRDELRRRPGARGRLPRPCASSGRRGARPCGPTRS